jgi:hypothetical protein
MLVILQISPCPSFPKRGIAEVVSRKGSFGKSPFDKGGFRGI